MHEDHVNNFATTGKNINTNVELEANLFAVALLSDSGFDAGLTVPLKDMNNYLLKGIVELNLKKK